jgi:hypothetical protein
LGVQSDEQIYELVAKELVTSPRQGLLIKCMAKCGGDENKGKAMYIETRVDEIMREIKQKDNEEAEGAARVQADLERERLKEFRVLEQERLKELEELEEQRDKEKIPIWLMLFAVVAVLFILYTSTL